MITEQLKHATRTSHAELEKLVIQWQQVVKNTSLPWLPGEVMAAENFRNFVWKKG
jgi:light-regulated signal transduction histidine kinase (bacteriophytochrome)